MLQFEKSYAGEDITFSLKRGEFSDLSSFRSFDSPFKACAGGFGLQWPSSIVTSVNEKLVQDIAQEDDHCTIRYFVRATVLILHIFFL